MTDTDRVLSSRVGSWRRRHAYEVKCYYPLDAQPPYAPGGLAIHTWNMDESIKNMEVEAALARRRCGEIGRIEVISLKEPAGTTEV